MPTIGVSIAVPDPVGTELQDFRVALGDESARHIPTHITLLPPYDVTGEALESVTEHLKWTATQSPSFRVHLRGTGTFRPISPVVFVNVVEGISRCEQLAHALRKGPFELERSFPYHPHVTVAHDLDEAAMDQAFNELSEFDCLFEVDRFWMYVHDDEHGWRPMWSFELNG